jgi:hypothetical protein
MRILPKKDSEIEDFEVDLALAGKIVAEQCLVEYRRIDESLYNADYDTVTKYIYQFECWYCNKHIIIGDVLVAIFFDLDDFELPDFCFICRNCFCKHHHNEQETRSS